MNSKEQNTTQSGLSPDPKRLDEVRATGYRPTVVTCFIHNKQVLLLFKKEYRLWMMPQSGVNSGEEIHTSLFNLIKDEMGEAFVKNCSPEILYVGEDEVEFLPDKQSGEMLQTADGKSYKMIGKHYFFFAVNVHSAEFDLSKTEFDEAYWFDSKAGLVLASKIYQSGKRRITTKALNLLKEQGIIG